MIRDSEKGLFDVVLVWKLDRFSRDCYDSARYKHILKKNGVKVVSAKEHISEGPEGIILESMLEGYAEYYSAELSEKIHRGQKENAMKVKNNDGGIPLGYVLNHQTQKLEIDPVTAPLVVEIFNRYADGETVRSIVDDLNRRGLRTRRGRPFRLNSLTGLLTNRKYIGVYQYPAPQMLKICAAVKDIGLRFANTGGLYCAFARGLFYPLAVSWKR